MKNKKLSLIKSLVILKRILKVRLKQNNKIFVVKDQKIPD